MVFICKKVKVLVFKSRKRKKKWSKQKISETLITFYNFHEIGILCIFIQQGL